MTFLRISAITAMLLSATGAAHAASDPAPPAGDHHSAVFDSPTHFDEQGGEAIFSHICAGCHMPGGTGAVGAGAYPRLAGDPKLEVAGYPIALVLHGQNAMPPLGGYFTDQQVADVVNYIRTHFGNDYKDAVAESDVKTAR